MEPEVALQWLGLALSIPINTAAMGKSSSCTWQSSSSRSRHDGAVIMLQHRNQCCMEWT